LAEKAQVSVDLIRKLERAVGILAIRDELTSLSDFPSLADEEVFNDEPPSADGLRLALAHAESIRQHGSFAQPGVMLPGLMAETPPRCANCPAPTSRWHTVCAPRCSIASTWVFFKQGRSDDAETAALRKAERVEPDFVRGSAESLAVRGILMLRAAGAAVWPSRPAS
jgi:hypothetical protein